MDTQLESSGGGNMEGHPDLLNHEKLVVLKTSVQLMLILYL